MINQNAPMSLSDLQQRMPTNSRWGNLEAMYNECLSMFGILTVYPQQARVLEPIATEEEKRHLQRILKNIETDCKAYLADLNNVRAQHLDPAGQPRKGIIYDSMTGDDLFQYTSIGAAYRNWMDGFQAITLQPANDFTVITETITKRQPATAQA